MSVQEITLKFTQEIGKLLEGRNTDEQVFALTYDGDIETVFVSDLVFYWGENAYYHVWNFNEGRTTGDIYRVVAVAEMPKVAIKPVDKLKNLEMVIDGYLKGQPNE